MGQEGVVGEPVLRDIIEAEVHATDGEAGLDLGLRGHRFMLLSGLALPAVTSVGLYG
jgi:hypothetical protein